LEHRKDSTDIIMRNRHILLILMLTAVVLRAQTGLSGPGDFNRQEGPGFVFDTFVRAGDSADSGMVSVSLIVPYKHILFNRDGGSYRAQVDVTVSLYLEGRRVGGFSDLKTVEVGQVNAKAELKYQREFLMPFGKYTAKAVVTDLNTQKRRTLEKPVDLTVLNTGGWQMGNLYLVRNREAEKDSSARYVSFGFSAAGHEGPVEFSYRVLNINGKEVRGDVFSLQLQPQARDYSFSIRSEGLQYREYRLELRTALDGQDYVRSIPFQIRWSGMNQQITNLDEAITQMRYLMMTNFLTREQFDIIENAQGDLQRNAFMEYWKSMDPTPGTDVNELMNEYYRRINESNMSFGAHRAGWETDRGMVYTIFGPPDDREIHNFELNTRPYIIWYYYTLNKYFIFVDYSGFGDFQLNQPIFDSLY